ncbi:hypothetical protein [Brevibacillus choshinensis]|uniref:hypothetical protein n=1 Tax=Brevibacillus choshinensis TaxID=54911 RepID=UPI002E21D0ED|nr:hypothetical protein [Brevibacillus choshinensis]
MRAILLPFFCFLLLLFGTNSTFAKPENTVKATMSLKVVYFNGIEPISDKSFTPIKNARFIVIDRSGEIVATGLSDLNGEWIVPLVIERDPRFPTKQMGTITLITVANGFNENLLFNVPVNEHGNGKGRASVSLRPVEPNRRNEPSYLNAPVHRFTMFDTLDYYAKKLGLKRQLQIDPHSLQWSPEISQ